MKVKKEDLITIANRLSSLEEKGEEKSTIFIEIASTLAALVTEYFKSKN